MSDIKSKVQEWIKNGKDFNDGISLLSQHSKNKSLVRNLSLNQNPTKADKLLYELLKLADLSKAYHSHSDLLKKAEPVKKALTSLKAKVIKKNATRHIEPPAGTKASEIKHSVPFNKLPLIVQEVIKQKGRLFREREQLHAILTNEKTQDNKPANVAARKIAGEKIDHISKRIDQLYEAEKSFKETGAAIPESIMDWSDEPAPETNKIIPDSSKLSDIELKNRLTNLRTYNTKDDNQLKYQSKSKGIDKPMPDGPKREEIERKIRMRKMEIDAIEVELKKRAGKPKEHKSK